jgi:uroporphyrinogen decarboxylase
MAEMTKWERVRAALKGQEVDRPPAGFWGHDFVREWTPQGLADATVEFVRRYGWDYQKVNPRATYYAEAWGATFQPAPDGMHSPTALSVPLRAADDLGRITPVDGTAGPFGEQLQALRLIGEALAGETPFIQTVFNPLSVIGYLANRDLASVRQWMIEAPAALHDALVAVTETLRQYARASIEAGAAGIFFATVDWGTRDNLSLDQYNRFARPYDLEVLAAVQDAEFNVLHVCRQNNMLMDLLDYPVQVVNWAETSTTNPSFADVLARTDKAVLGGIDHETFNRVGPDEIERELAAALQQTGGRRYLVGPGCSIPPDTPPENLKAVMTYLLRNAGE